MDRLGKEQNMFPVLIYSSSLYFIYKSVFVYICKDARYPRAEVTDSFDLPSGN